jgi:mevalonate kinase
MLMGEHSVLHGQPAISAAVDRNIHVELTPRNDKHIVIQSVELGEASCHLDDIIVIKPFTFVFTAIKQQAEDLPSGFTLNISSEMDSQLGLGTSAAVTVATLRVIDAWINRTPHDGSLLHRAIKVIRDVQGRGSGADAAASVYGGAVYYEVALCQATKLPHTPTISLVYSGSKMPTADVIRIVDLACKDHPSLYQSLYEKMGDCTRAAKQCFIEQDWETLGHLFHQQQQLMEALGVSTDLLNELITKAMTIDGILGAKISGSGLGDCIVALGELQDGTFPATTAQHETGVMQLDIGTMKTDPR